MNIVILGAGTVGTSIAELLCHDSYHVTVVDIAPEKTQALNEKLDVRVVNGSASQSSVLFQAGISNSDVCLAVTGSDEVNIVAASLAKAMGCHRTIARVYAPVFRDLSTFDYQNHFQIDRMLSLEHLTAMALARAIRDPSSVVMEQFARGGLQATEVVIEQECKGTRSNIRNLDLPPNVRIGTIQRDNRMWIASANDQLLVGDRVNVFCRPENIKLVYSFFKISTRQNKRVVIGGGGETGFHLAKTLERDHYKVTLLENDEQRCEKLADLLNKTVVINCDASAIDNLEEERVGNADFFVACTGDDEDNIMLAVGAKDLGADQVLSVISRSDYGSIIAKLGIDLAVSQRGVMAKQIIAYMTEGIVMSRAKLPGGLVHIIDVEIRENSSSTETPLSKLGLPDRCLVVAIIRQDHVRVPVATDQLEPGDNVVFLVEDDVVDAALARFA